MFIPEKYLYGNAKRPIIVLDAGRPQNLIMDGNSVLNYYDTAGSKRFNLAGHTASPSYSGGKFVFGAGSDLGSGLIWTSEAMGDLHTKPFIEQRHDAFVVVEDYVAGDIINIGERNTATNYKTRITRITSSGVHHSSRGFLNAILSVNDTSNNPFTSANLPQKFVLRTSFVPEYRPGNMEPNNMTSEPMLLEYAWNIHIYINGQLALSRPWWVVHDRNNGNPSNHIIQPSHAYFRLGNGAANNNFSVRYAALYEYGTDAQMQAVEQLLMNEYI